nr:hypothetical protein LTR18_002337 [Exophiala xenobiotica]
MWLIDILHHLLEYCLSFVNLVQNREVGCKTLNRKTGKYVREQQPLLKKLKLLALFSRFVEWIDKTHAMRLIIHNKTIKQERTEGPSASARQIQSFVEFYGVNMEDFDPSDIQEYKTFEEFFVRQHRPEKRPIFAKDDSSKAVCVADSRLVVYPTVEETRKLWIKGKNFTIADLIQDRELAEAWHDGAVASFRLSPARLSPLPYTHLRYYRLVQADPR